MKMEQARAGFVARSTYAATTIPPELAALSAADMTELDVREDLRNGIEPFTRIMAAQAAVPMGGALRLRAIFEPIPLYTVLGKQGFSHWTERIADDDWCVWFYRGDFAETLSAGAPAIAMSASDDDKAEANLLILDVRGLEPPEPMTRTLEALSELQPGQSLLQVNARIPQFLLPLLQERGFEYVLVSEHPDEVRGVIRRVP